MSRKPAPPGAADVCELTCLLSPVSSLMIGGVRVRALYDYIGQETDELSFKAGKLTPPPIPHQPTSLREKPPGDVCVSPQGRSF